MKCKIKKMSGTGRQFEIEMPKEAVEELFSVVLEDIRKEAKIPGFRPGKAPLDIVRKKHAEDAMDEVKRRMIPVAYQQALKEHGIEPVSYPEISEVAIEMSGALTFKAKVDTSPAVALKKYKGLKAASSAIEVTDAEVEEVTSRIRNMHAEFIDIDGPLAKGNFGICDVETHGEAGVIAKKRENMWIEADKEASLLGMGEELCGLKKGDKKDIEVTLPDNYPDKKYAGKKAVFKVEVKGVKEKKLPETGPQLALKMGKETMEDVRSELRGQLMARKEADARIGMKNQIMEQLLAAHSFDIPETMVERQLRVLVEKAENELLQKGVAKAEIEGYQEKIKGQLRKDAENKVRLYFIFSRIADQEKVEVTDEDIDGWLKALAASYNQPFEEVKKYYQERDLMDGLREQLREDKTLDLLLSEAAVSRKDTKA
ncbi:MAG: trigger factor [Candidatus Omnitrophota bacterium]